MKSKNDYQIIKLCWIVAATASRIKNSCGSDEDVNAGIGEAIAVYNQGGSAANAIYQGSNFARLRINSRKLKRDATQTQKWQAVRIYAYTNFSKGFQTVIEALGFDGLNRLLETSSNCQEAIERVENEIRGPV